MDADHLKSVDELQPFVEAGYTFFTVDPGEHVDNAAGTGARLALPSKVEREKADEIARQDNYIELAKIPNFNRKFAEATYL